MDANIEEKYYGLKKLLREMGSALLAYSGGTDSTLLLAVGRESLGDNMMAVTVHSPLHPREMLEGAASMAARLRVEHITVDSDELENEDFAANNRERCYICKHDRFAKIIDIAAREGICEVVEGSQLDDLGDYRPGMDAVSELGVRSPLLECGFMKYEVRSLSRELGLSTWNMPPSTCFATRIPYGEEITRDKISVIDKGEKFLSEMGFTQVRLRLLGDSAVRIEVNPKSIEKLASEGVGERVLSKLRDLGFAYVTLDLAGYRSGSLNEVLEDSVE